MSWPILQSQFFQDLPPSAEFFTPFRDQFAWNEEIMPVYEWEDLVYIATSAPEIYAGKTDWPKNWIIVEAAAVDLRSLWISYSGGNEAPQAQPEKPAEDSIHLKSISKTDAARSTSSASGSFSPDDFFAGFDVDGTDSADDGALELSDSESSSESSEEGGEVSFGEDESAAELNLDDAPPGLDLNFGEKTAGPTNLNSLRTGTASAIQLAPAAEAPAAPVKATAPKPAANSPLAKSSSPLEKNPAPLAKSSSPLAKSSSPLEKNPAPLAKSSAPLEKNSASLAKNSSPLEKNSAPLAKSSSPLEKNPAPLAKSSSPLEKNPAPAALAKSPPPPPPTQAPKAPVAPHVVGSKASVVAPTESTTTQAKAPAKAPPAPPSGPPKSSIVPPKPPPKAPPPVAAGPAKPPSAEFAKLAGELANVPSLYHTVLVARKAGNSVRVSYWPESLNSGPLEYDFSLGTPSPFRIVLRTEKPYHGYVVETPFLTQFFKHWNGATLPETFTVVPVDKDSSVVGFVIAMGSAEAFDRETLTSLEQAAAKIAKAWPTSADAKAS